MNIEIREVFNVDEVGFIIDNHVAEFRDNVMITDFGEMLIIDTPLPQPLSLIKPKWNGTEWVEGESSEEKAEREAQQMLESLKPSQNEIEDAKIKVVTLNILKEMGIVQ